MRPVFIFCIAAFTFSGCAKKTTPTSSVGNTTATESKPVTETKAPDEIKTETTSPLTESSVSIAGKSTFEAKCGRCHGLKNPADYTEKQWEPILNIMALRARLDSTEKANVLAYVTFHAKPAN